MKEAHILLVEDNEGDIFLTTEALAEVGVPLTVSVVRNGREALDYVFRREPYAEARLPDLILLDINLPLKSGHEVLQMLKEEETTCHIPVIVLTTSAARNDVIQAYKLHANGYITKPMDMPAFTEVITNLVNFWLRTVSLPSFH